jgi:hypothetical protein
MTIIQPYKKFYTTATTWNELTGVQLLQVMKAFGNKKYNEVQLLLKLLKIICDGMGWWHFLRLGKKLEDFIYLVTFLFNENTLTKQLLPRYQCKKTGEVFYGPADELTNLVMKEFVFSEDYFMRWSDDKENTELLNEFVAVLYRPVKHHYDFNKNKDGDARIAFNENVCNWYAKDAVCFWPTHVKMAIATWYSHSRQKLVDDNPDVFGGSGEPAKYGLLEVMHNVAEEAVFGNFKEVENQYVNLVLISLNIAVRKAAAIKQHSKA